MQRVVVNLCLASMEAGLLGVDGHVCEVQLTTAAFVRVQAKCSLILYTYNTVYCCRLYVSLRNTKYIY